MSEADNFVYIGERYNELKERVRSVAPNQKYSVNEALIEQWF